MTSLIQSTIQTSIEMQNRLVEKATEDEDFRTRLLEDANAAIKNEYGIDVPDFIKIQVHESDSSVLHLALPPDSNVELDEERMEAIAAGLSCCL